MIRKRRRMGGKEGRKEGKEERNKAKKSTGVSGGIIQMGEKAKEWTFIPFKNHCELPQ